jgi:hypothetical protein
MWGQNRPASNQPVESLILWLLRPQTLQFRQLGISAFEQDEQKNPKRQRGTFALGVGGSSFAEAIRYVLFEARQPTRSSAACVTQTPHPRQP